MRHTFIFVSTVSSNFMRLRIAWLHGRNLRVCGFGITDWFVVLIREDVDASVVEMAAYTSLEIRIVTG